MKNVTEFLLLAFLAITFLQSGYDKLSDWNGNLSWLKGHFEKTPIKNMVPASLALILLLEAIAGILCVAGIVALLVNGSKIIGFWGAVVSSIALLLLLLGQRMAKDYDGARTIAIYFLVSVFAVFVIGA